MSGYVSLAEIFSINIGYSKVRPDYYRLGQVSSGYDM